MPQPESGLGRGAANGANDLPPIDTARILGHADPEEALLPTSKMDRAGIVLAEGAQGFLPGLGHAIMDDIDHPLRTLGMLGGSAALGAATKVLLPERGPVAMIGAGVLGAYFIGTTAYGVYESVDKGVNAKSRAELDQAGQELGDVGGGLVVNGILSGGAYGLGRYGGGRLLLSETMDGFADRKANFWGTADNPLNLKGNLASDGVSKAGTVGVASRLQVDGETTRLLYTDRQAPQGILKGEVDPNAQMDISVYLKSKASDLQLERHVARMTLGRSQPLTQAEFGARFGAEQSSLDKLTQFARDNSLTINSSDLTSGRVELSGSTADMQKAFGTKLAHYEHASGATFRGRQGMLSVPTYLAKDLDGVYGLDDRVQAHSRIVRLTDADIAAAAIPEGVVGDEAAGGGKGKATKPRATRSYIPSEVADIYQFPKGYTGKGVTVAVPELGGGFDPQDNAVYFKSIGQRNPDVDVVTIDGVKNKPDGANGAQGEVHLDSQVIGSVAPDARQRLVFSANTDRGFIDSINRSTFHVEGETPADSISISWGGPEDTWSKQGLRGMNQEFKKAVAQGKRVYAAAGDDGAMDGSPSKTYQVDFPASSIWVTGLGGTSLIGDPATGTITSESVWNRGRGAGGGGISEQFPVPDYQKGLKLPKNANGSGPGRGVPDIAFNSDPGTGYRMRAGGEDQITGGTSAAAPLAAGLDARITEALHGSGKQMPTPFNNYIYGLALTNPTVFNDVVKGSNKGYPAGVGWDAASGLGSINGTEFLKAIKNGPAKNATVVKITRFIQPAFLSAGSDDQANAG
jgi:kumamolisin